MPVSYGGSFCVGQSDKMSVGRFLVRYLFGFAERSAHLNIILAPRRGFEPLFPA